MAAVLAARPAVASHLSAGWIWELLRYRPETIDVTAPTRRRAKRDFRVHFSALASQDVAAESGIPVTSIARTMLDLAGMLRPASLEAVLERSEERGVFDLTAIEDVRGRYAHHPGAGRLREALSVYKDDPRVLRSRLERRFLGLVREAGLPLPATNFNVAGLELDAYWEDERFAVELDVYETHGTRAAFERDRVRADDLLAIGVEMVRVTGPRLDREPQAVIRRLADHLARRRSERA